MEEKQPALRDVLVVGGGLAGLAAAIALGRRGVSATVVERGANVAGTVLRFQYRPVYALHELGILDEVVARGLAVSMEQETARQIWNPSDREAIAMPDLGDDWELPFAVDIYRPVLAEIMASTARAQGAEILIGETYREIKQDRDGVRVELTTGEQRAFDLVVAADGIHSGLRERFFPDAGEPTYTGSMGFRTMFYDPPPHWRSGMRMVDGHLVVTKMMPGDLFYLGLPNHMERRRIEQDEARAIMRGVLAGCEDSEQFAEIAARLTEQVEVAVVPFEWIFVAPPWHRGRIVLAGDAAHATAPSIGSSGGMALEDALVLADELFAHDDLEAGLIAYARRRHDRVKLVVDTSVDLMRGAQQGRPRHEWAAQRALALGKLAEAY